MDGIETRPGLSMIVAVEEKRDIRKDKDKI